MHSSLSKKLIVLVLLLLAFPVIVNAMVASKWQTHLPNQLIATDKPLETYFRAEGSGMYNLSSSLWSADCSTLIAHIADHDRVELRNSWQKILFPTDRLTVSNPGNNGCIKICVVESGKTESSCVASKILTSALNKVNSGLQFTRYTTPRLVIKNSQQWSYQFKAEDSQKSKIHYKVAGPDFLKLNTETGELKADLAELGDYQILVLAQNQIGQTTNFKFNLTVQSTETNSNFVSEQTTNTTLTSDTQIVLVKPLNTDLLNGRTNEVKWVISDADSVSGVLIQYSKVGSNQWEKLFLAENINLPTYEQQTNWDVSKLADGNYLIRFTVLDAKNNVKQVLSPELRVGNSTGNVTGSVPLITEITPGTGAEINDRSPLISGRLVAGENAKIDPGSFSLKLNGSEIKNRCTITVDSFKCQIENNLPGGSNELKAQVSDNLGRIGVRTWLFTVVVDLGSSTPQTTNQPQISSGLPIMLAIICVIFMILIAVPWILYLLWRRQDSENSPLSKNSEYIDYAQTPTFTPPLQPITTVNTNNFQPSTPPTTNDYMQPQTSPIMQSPPVANYVQPQPTIPPPVENNFVTTTPPLSSSYDPLAPAVPIQPVTNVTAQPATGNTNANTVPSWLQSPDENGGTFGSFGTGQKQN